MSDVEDPDVTIVVASRNRRDELVASLARHRAPVVYVDNASTDGSVEAVRAAHPDVGIVELPRNVGAYARTLGVRRATTPYVAFADDDSWWAPGALAAAAQALRDHPRLAVVNGRILVGPDERLDPVCEEMAASPLPSPPGTPGAALLGFVACAVMVRVEAFTAAGGFDPVVRFPGEEERLALDLASAGWAMSYLDDVAVHHHPSPRRHAPEERRRAITRSSVLTGFLRLPWPRAAARASRAVTAGGPERAGALAALRELPTALRHRRVVPGRVLARLDLLEAGATTPPAAAHPGPVTDDGTPAAAHGAPVTAGGGTVAAGPAADEGGHG
ncbi:glycosyltransferase family 2 protein [Georgenia sp. AZ-5]|uniref:glycosyltransferase family 2 protein n=1 Tax=Georgenia sp. AZ-5 TaxID=3367526 RepID=UPI00375463DD